MTISHLSEDAWKYVFNTPLECGLRCAILLVEGFPARCDLHRLVQYEYLLVHSGDIPDGPPSLHPAAPHRAGELLVRRGVVERGVMFMMSRSIICREFDSGGISYFAGEWAVPFLDGLSTDYTREMRRRATWLDRRFGQMDRPQLEDFMRSNWANWGSEFTRDFFLTGGE